MPRTRASSTIRRVPTAAHGFDTPSPAHHCVSRGTLESKLCFPLLFFRGLFQKRSVSRTRPLPPQNNQTRLQTVCTNVCNAFKRRLLRVKKCPDPLRECRPTGQGDQPPVCGPPLGRTKGPPGELHPRPDPRWRAVQRPAPIQPDQEPRTKNHQR